MARLSPETYKPQLGFRFRIVFSQLPNIQFYGKATSLPVVENNPLSVEYGNTYMKVKGKTRWNDITITCYEYERMTMDELWDYLTKLHQDVELGKDFYADEYKKDITIQLLSPKEQTVGTWRLIGAFIASLNPGQLDFSSEEVVQPELVIAYDYARYEKQPQQQE